MINKAFKNLSYAVFPRRCDICGEVTFVLSARCDNCLKLKRITGKLCNKCGKPKSLCDCKRFNAPDYDGIVAPFYYEDNVKNAVHRFKFGKREELSLGMSNEMLRAIKQHYGDIKFDEITYVPISEKRQAKRGYNQSRLLAEHISKRLNIPVSNALVKVRDITSQRNSTAFERRANVFATIDVAENSLVEGKTFLLVDDVKTTGSTISECAAVLKTYGAQAVYAVTLAIR